MFTTSDSARRLTSSYSRHRKLRLLPTTARLLNSEPQPLSVYQGPRMVDPVRAEEAQVPANQMQIYELSRIALPSMPGLDCDGSTASDSQTYRLPSGYPVTHLSSQAASWSSARSQCGSAVDHAERQQIIIAQREGSGSSTSQGQTSFTNWRLQHIGKPTWILWAHALRSCIG